jgi:hypothetical protein
MSPAAAKAQVKTSNEKLKVPTDAKVTTQAENEILTTVVAVARQFRTSIKNDVLKHKAEIIILKEQVFEVVKGSKGKRVKVDGEYVYFKDFVTSHFQCALGTLYNLLSYPPAVYCKKCGELKNACKKQGPCAPPNHTQHPKYVDGYEHGVADERKKHELADDGLSTADLYRGNDGKAFITSLAELVRDFCRRNEMCDVAARVHIMLDKQ